MCIDEEPLEPNYNLYWLRQRIRTQRVAPVENWPFGRRQNYPAQIQISRNLPNMHEFCKRKYSKNPNDDPEIGMVRKKELSTMLDGIHYNQLRFRLNYMGEKASARLGKTKRTCYERNHEIQEFS
jgi:hypothetical protein